MMTQKACIMVGLRYRDTNAALDWLCKALGLAASLVMPDEHKGVVHAQRLLPSGGMIMPSSFTAPAAAEITEITEITIGHLYLCCCCRC